MQEDPSFLVALDDFSVLVILEEIMKERFFYVRVATTPGEAVTLVRRRKFDVVVTNVSMIFDFQQTQTLSALQANNPALKWLVMLGYEDDERVLADLGSQPRIELYKPFTVEEFFQAIEQLRAMPQHSRLRKILRAVCSI